MHSLYKMALINLIFKHFVKCSYHILSYLEQGLDFLKFFYSQSLNCYKIVDVKRRNSVSQIDKLVFIAIERSDTFG
mgnify:CR=1 FL=1